MSNFLMYFKTMCYVNIYLNVNAACINSIQATSHTNMDSYNLYYCNVKGLVQYKWKKSYFSELCLLKNVTVGTHVLSVFTLQTCALTNAMIKQNQREFMKETAAVSRVEPKGEINKCSSEAEAAAVSPVCVSPEAHKCQSHSSESYLKSNMISLKASLFLMILCLIW